MIVGWKKHPYWRMYFDMKRERRRILLEQRREYEQQMQAIHAAADEILMHAQIEATKNHEPRH